MGIIVIIIVGVLFYFKAKKNDFNPYLWAFIGIGSLFLGLFIAAFILAMLDPEIIGREISNQTLYIVGGSAILNCVIVWFLMQSKINEKKW